MAGMRTLLVTLFLLAGFYSYHRAFVSVARADGGSNGSAAIATDASVAGSSTPIAGAPLLAPATAPSLSDLHDPISSPAAAFDDVKAAKKIGWLVAVLAGLVLLGKGLARASQTFAFLGKGKAAIVIALLGTTAAGCYNAAASGGSWTAVLIAAVVGIAHYKDATPAAASS